MAETKYPTIRYQVLNRCFRNKYRRYDIEALIDACKEAIYEYSGKKIGCSRRTILNDIAFMESDAGWSIDLERIRDGHKVYFRYSDPDFSINNTVLSEEEFNKLNEIILLLERFKGMPCFEWVDDILLKLNSGFKKSSDTIIEFEQVHSLKGTEHIDKLFNAILNRQVIDVSYRPYYQEEHVWTIHPYLIKQFNNRWFLFGRNAFMDGMIYNLALNRIVAVENNHKTSYMEADESFHRLLDNVVGVTRPVDTEIEEIRLRFSEHRFPYVVTKPLHRSQKVIDENERIISVNIIPNMEFEAMILQFGKDVEVLSPDSFRDRIKNIILEMSSLY